MASLHKDSKGEEKDITALSLSENGADNRPEKVETTIPDNAEKKSKTQKLKDIIGKPRNSESRKKGKPQKTLDDLPADQIAQLLKKNPALAGQLQDAASNNDSGDMNLATSSLRHLELREIITGLAASGKNAKDMGAYKFWSTQPVPNFDENKDNKNPVVEGPIKIQSIEEIPKEPSPMPTGYEWCTVDISKKEELQEVCELLSGHYVEDDEAMFRFNYSASLLQWAMMPPGWKKDWHVGVRVSSNKKLVAFISAVPLELRVREKVLHASDVNFLVVHKKLRSKRLAPTLIKEVTRRCNLEGVFQAIYTGGNVLPTPVSTCRYYHRPINWKKLYDVGFSPLPPNSKPAYQIRKYALPDGSSLKGFREMQEKDVGAVHNLLTRYLQKFDLAMCFSKSDIIHWLLHEKRQERLEEQVVWSFVVENEYNKITDYISFYCLESSVLQGSPAHNHKNVRAANLFYYATEIGLNSNLSDKTALKTRLNALVADCMVHAKRYKFDVFNALSLMENGLFLETQKFGGGDGQLHYYLFNYRANPIAGGVDSRNNLDQENLSGIGFTML